MTLRIADMARLNGVALHGCEALMDAPIARVLTDSRELRAGDVFVAFAGARVDGHAMVGAAIAAGAVACVVRNAWWRKHRSDVASLPLVVVPDTMRAFGEIARLHRNHFDIPVLGITGSNGKTGTKEMLAAVLRTKYRVLATEGNFNNHIGLPATLLRLDDSAQVVVLEMGTNQPGDIAWLCDIARPTHGVITNIGRAHIEKLLSREGIAEEKSALYRALPSGGVAIVNADEPLLRGRVPRRARRIGYGYAAKADVRITQVTLDAQARPTVRFEAPAFVARPFTLTLHAIGRHAAMNAAAALATGFAFGCSLRAMKQAIERVESYDKRMQVVEAGGITMLNDTYNANPDSVLAGLGVLCDMRSEGERCAVLGDMLELGSAARAEHERIGEAVVDAGIPMLLTLGRASRALHRAARARAEERGQRLVAQHFTDVDQLVAALDALLALGDVVLVKGSRGMRMERIVDELRLRRGSMEARV